MAHKLEQSLGVFRQIDKGVEFLNGDPFDLYSHTRCPFPIATSISCTAGRSTPRPARREVKLHVEDPFAVSHDGFGGAVGVESVDIQVAAADHEIDVRLALVATQGREIVVG